MCVAIACHEKSRTWRFQQVQAGDAAKIAVGRDHKRPPPAVAAAAAVTTTTTSHQQQADYRVCCSKEVCGYVRSGNNERACVLECVGTKVLLRYHPSCFSRFSFLVFSFCSTSRHRGNHLQYPGPRCTTTATQRRFKKKITREHASETRMQLTTCARFPGSAKRDARKMCKFV